MDQDIPYLLLTPGPLTTTRTVRAAMQQDLSTWDVDYNRIVQQIRYGLVRLAGDPDRDTAVLMQGSGTFAVEATIGSVIPESGKLLVIRNGAYGDRMLAIAQRLGISIVDCEFEETEPPSVEQISKVLDSESGITHVAVVHCETTTGILNPVERIGNLKGDYGFELIVDAMSTLGGLPCSMDSLNADYLISSANKCIQGVPGFGLVIARRNQLQATHGRARSVSLDLWDQWNEMETKEGKWRFTSPTHVVCAFSRALEELQYEGGVDARHARYATNQRLLVEGMQSLGFRTLIPDQWHSPIITSFHVPVDNRFSFPEFYDRLKQRKYVIYPGKVSRAETFRIGTIGHVQKADIEDLIVQVGAVIRELDWQVA